MLNDKNPIVDPITGEINIKFNPLPINEDFFIPCNDDEPLSIDTLNSLVEDSCILINDPHATNRRIFKIPVGKINEVESKSFIQKLKDKLKKK